MKIKIDGRWIIAKTAQAAVSELRQAQFQVFVTNAELKDEMTHRVEVYTGERIEFETPMQLLQTLEEFGFIEIHDDDHETSSETESPMVSQKPD